METYVRTVILSEFDPPAASLSKVEGMLEVQAIVTRTYALSGRHRSDGFDLCSSTHCQVYDPARAATSRWSSQAAAAVRNTAGVIVWAGESPARVVYHADCGGRTSAAQDVWEGTPVPYLASVRDDDVGVVHRPWQFAPETSVLLTALNADVRTRVGAFLSRIDVIQRDAAGRVQLMALDGERSPVLRGEEFRTLMSRAFGPRAIRSTWFDVTRTSPRFEFTGRGFGHGVGLCQVGAYTRIAAGSTPTDVLTHYFPGTSIH